MEIKELKKRSNIAENKKLISAFTQYNELLKELKTKELSDQLIMSINMKIDDINFISGSEKEWGKQIRKSQSSILSLLEKELKLVTKNHYRNTWHQNGPKSIPRGKTN